MSRDGRCVTLHPLVRQIVIRCVTSIVLSLILLFMQPLQIGAQPRQLTGFKYIILSPLVYTGGSRDIYELEEYLKERLGREGWEFTSAEEVAGNREVLSQTLACAMDHTAVWAGRNTVNLSCSDVLGQEMVRLRGSATHRDMEGDLKASIRNIAEQVKDMRSGGFDPQTTVDILSLIPNIERHPLTLAELDDRIAASLLTHPLEGVWSTGNDQLGITREDTPTEFVAVALNSTGAVWEPGMVKARFTETADSRIFLVRYRTLTHQELSGAATLEGAVLKIVVRDSDGEDQEFSLIKLRPSVSAASGSAPDVDRNPPDSVAGASGSAFVVHPSGLLLTANHVVEDATRIEVSCGGQLARPAVVKSSAPSTDLALLEVSGLAVESYLTFSQTLPALGAEVFTVGYPLVDLLGVEPKYTEGTISALSGPGGDASYMQISVPVQPGNSGGPLVNQDGEVVGVVIATASAPTFFQASGTIPQNINWAVKGIFAAALFVPLPSQESISQESVIDRVRQSTCLVLTTR